TVNCGASYRSQHVIQTQPSVLEKTSIEVTMPVVGRVPPTIGPPFRPPFPFLPFVLKSSA
ncbi:hypothetical protein, partial [Endothiovibrio diazotrophicus]